MSTQYPKRSLLQLYNDSEFLAEHFGFLPIEVLDELYNAYNFVFYRANEALETYIKSLSAEPDHEVEKAVSRFEAYVEKVLDENFNTFQQYFYDNILKLPPHINIPLKHHEGLDLECTEEQEDLIDQELEKARRAVLAQKAFRHLLEKKMKQLQEDKDKNFKDWYISQIFGNHAQNDTVKFVAEHCAILTEKVEALVHKVEQENALRPDYRTGLLAKILQAKLDYNRKLQKSQ